MLYFFHDVCKKNIFSTQISSISNIAFMETTILMKLRHAD